MDIESQIQKANNAIKHAKAIQHQSKKLLLKNNDDPHSLNLSTLYELSEIMEKVASSTEKSMNGAKLAESRARSRLMAVKKASAKTIKFTAKAKSAAIASRKAANAALLTSKKMTTPQLQKRHQKTYAIQIHASINAAKIAQEATLKASEAAKTARIAARMPLEEMQI